MLNDVCEFHWDCYAENTGCYNGICDCLKGYCYTGDNCLEESKFTIVRRCALFIQLILGVGLSWVIVTLARKDDVVEKLISLLARKFGTRRIQWPGKKLSQNDLTLLCVAMAHLSSLTIYVGQIVLSFDDPLLRRTNYFLTASLPLMLFFSNGTLVVLGCSWLKLAIPSTLPRYTTVKVIAATAMMAQIILVAYFGFIDLWEIGLNVTGFGFVVGLLCIVIGGFFIHRRIKRYGMGLRMQLMCRAISTAVKRISICCVLLAVAFALLPFTMYNTCVGFSIASLMCIAAYEGVLLSILMFLDKRGTVFSKSNRNLVAPAPDNVVHVARPSNL